MFMKTDTPRFVGSGACLLRSGAGTGVLLVPGAFGGAVAPVTGDVVTESGGRVVDAGS